LNDAVIVDREGKAEAFNYFFADVSYVDYINHDIPDDIDLADIEVFGNINVSVEDVLDQLSAIDISKAYGPDGIPTRLCMPDYLLTHSKTI
jgi:hypothetical protein